MLEVGDVQSIKRLYYSQRWSKRQIARELGISRNTVRRVLNGAWDGRYTLADARARPIGDEISPIVRQYLTGELEDETHPKQRLTAARLTELLRENHDYTGSDRTVRRIVSELRPLLADPLSVAMVPLSYEPGIDAQVDFLEADVRCPEGVARKTFLLVRACYSSRCFACRVPAENQEALFESLNASFEFFGGVFQNLWFDNMTTAVEKVLKSRARKVQHRFEAFKAHYGFASEFCAPGKANEKGGVEKGVSYFRRTCLSPVPRVCDEAELDELIRSWLTRQEGHTPDGRQGTVGQMWQDEVEHLIPLVGPAFDSSRLASRKVMAYSLVRFETNAYSVPVEYVRRRLTVKCYAERIEIHDRYGLVACHPRLYGQRQVSFQLEHYLPLLSRKTRAFDRAAPVKAALPTWPKTYPLLLKVLRDREGEANGTRDFIQILWLHRDHPNERVYEGVRQALRQEQPSYAHVWAYVDAAQRAAEPPEELSAETCLRFPEVQVDTGDVAAYLSLCTGGGS